MSSAGKIRRKFRASDGRIKVATLFGVSAVVTVIALLVGVLPVFAIAGDQLDADVAPKEIRYGGGDGGCAFVGSAAANELHINNPTNGVFTDGTVTITVDVYSSDTLFSFTVNTPGFAVYDVTVNGGAKSNLYDYDGGPGPVGTDEDLHAPGKGNGQLFRLSHINFCYDVQLFFCDGTVTHATRLNDGIFTEASALLVSNSGNPTCLVKEGTFVIDNEASPPLVELNFGDGTGTVAGRLDITKDFGDPSFGNLLYDGALVGLADVPDCGIHTKLALDGDEFDDVLASDEYPHLPGNPGDHTACKVYEGENAAGIQYNVVYFEFEDPHFF